MAEVSYYTKEGLEKLKEELQYLKTTGRANISAAIAEARDKGDLSENADYDAAKEARSGYESR
jgi:transcription elongation factor GreA